MSEIERKKNLWDRVGSLAKAATAVLVPAAIAAAGWMIEQGVREQETSVRYVELAVAILSEDETEMAESLKEWATSILAEYSPVTLPPAARIDLRDRRLPPGVFSRGPGSQRSGEASSSPTRESIAQLMRSRSDLREAAVEELRRVQPDLFRPARGS